MICFLFHFVDKAHEAYDKYLNSGDEACQKGGTLFCNFVNGVAINTSQAVQDAQVSASEVEDKLTFI